MNSYRKFVSSIPSPLSYRGDAGNGRDANSKKEQTLPAPDNKNLPKPVISGAVQPAAEAANLPTVDRQDEARIPSRNTSPATAQNQIATNERGHSEDAPGVDKGLTASSSDSGMRDRTEAQADKKVLEEEHKVLTFRQLFSISLMKAAIIYNHGIVIFVFQQYLESYGMSIAVLSIISAVSNCLDFILSFGVGYMSDNWKGRHGRRKPFIVVGAVAYAIATLLLAFPPDALLPQNVREVRSHTPDGGTVCTAATQTPSAEGTCDATRRCVQASIEGGILPPWTGTSMQVDEPLNTTTILAHGALSAAADGGVGYGGLIAYVFAATLLSELACIASGP